MVQKVHCDRWEAFISHLENDLHGRQTYTCKVLKHLNMQDKDTVFVNNIREAKCISFYKNLWYNSKW